MRGHLDPAWRASLAGLAIAHEAVGTSRLSGPLPDQAALHGVLLQLVRLGLAICSLETTAHAAPGPDGELGNR